MTERLAWVVLRTANRTQAKNSTARVVVPRDPEMADELGQELDHIPTDEDLLSAEEYLEEHGYLALTDIGLTRGTYTITAAGLRWIREEPPATPETPRTAEEPEGAQEEPRPAAGGAPQEDTRRPWWRRVFGR